MINNQQYKKSGFTLTEIIVVITVVAILATIGAIAYYGYQTTMIRTQLKSDLNGAASTMEDARNYNSYYPSNVPSNFRPSEDVSLVGGSFNGKLYCIDATSSKNTSIHYYIDETLSSVGAMEGTCASRPATAGDCADSGLYGIYPNCYDYDSYPIATSISGYWEAAPIGYLLEDGSAVSCDLYADLYEAIYSGTCSGTFNLPNSTGRVTVSRSTESEFNLVGETGGSKDIQLTTSQIPLHSHSGSFADTWHGHSFSGNLFGSGSITSHDYNGSQSNAANTAHVHFYSVSTNGPSAQSSVKSEGGNQPHNEMQPSIAKSFAIKYTQSTGSDSRLPAATSISGYWDDDYKTELSDLGWLFEDGAEISRTGIYEPLFNAVGTTYGTGDGTSTFQIPDSRGRVAVNMDATTEFDSFIDRPGTKAVTITNLTMPSHNHDNSAFANSSHQHGYSGTTTSLYYSGAPAGTSVFDNDNSDKHQSSSTGHTHGFSGASSWNANSARTVANEGSDQSHSNLQPYIVKTFAIKYTVAAGDVDTLPKGTSVQGYWTNAPEGYMLEDGRLVSCIQYADLYKALHGGACTGDFAIPDSRGMVAVGRDTTNTNIDEIGDKYGTKYHTLTVGQMPTHSHPGSTFASSWHQHSYWFEAGLPGSAILGQNLDDTPVSVANLNHRHRFDGNTDGTAQNSTIGSFGSGQAHDNIQPSIVSKFAIKY